MRVVLDTNVIVSGLLRPASVPALVLSLLATARVQAVVDARILEEYRDVLSRPRLKIPDQIAREFLNRFASSAEHIMVDADVVSGLGRLTLKDPDDRLFMEVAISGGVGAIVTGNVNHFPRSALKPIRVLTPRQLLDELDQAGET
ncbi:MAG: putative toxin-antitoxin system toxin component, PIN family [Longimicrobiales bacterium]